MVTSAVCKYKYTRKWETKNLQFNAYSGTIRLQMKDKFVLMYILLLWLQVTLMASWNYSVLTSIRKCRYTGSSFTLSTVNGGKHGIQSMHSEMKPYHEMWCHYYLRGAHSCLQVEYFRLHMIPIFATWKMGVQLLSQVQWFIH